MEILTRHRVAIVAALCTMFVLGHFGASMVWPREGRWLRGDARRYYVYLPSMVIDHDLDLRNDYAALDPPAARRGDVESSDAAGASRVGNLAPVGAAIFWLPFFLIGLLAQSVAELVGGGSVTWHGYGFLPQAAVLVAGIVYAGGATLLTARVAEHYVEPAFATAAAITVWLAGPALYYTAVSPAYSHTTAWFAVAIGLCVWLAVRERPPGGRTWLAWGVCGLAFGLAAIVRQQDLAFLAVPVLDAAARRREAGWSGGARVTALAALGGGVLVGIVPQLLVWHELYGWFLGNPMGGGILDTASPWWLESLVGFGFFGLFSWTPVTAVGLLGLVALARQRLVVALSYLLPVVVFIYYQAASSAFQLGTSFGARRFVSANVVFAVGLAVLWDRWSGRSRAWPLAACSALIVWNGILLFAYEFLVHERGQHLPLGAMLRWLFTGQM